MAGVIILYAYHSEIRNYPQGQKNIKQMINLFIMPKMTAKLRLGKVVLDKNGNCEYTINVK